MNFAILTHTLLVQLVHEPGRWKSFVNVKVSNHNTKAMLFLQKVFDTETTPRCTIFQDTLRLLLCSLNRFNHKLVKDSNRIAVQSHNVRSLNLKGRRCHKFAYLMRWKKEWFLYVLHAQHVLIFFHLDLFDWGFQGNNDVKSPNLKSCGGRWHTTSLNFWSVLTSKYLDSSRYIFSSVRNNGTCVLEWIYRCRCVRSLLGNFSFYDEYKNFS